MSIKENLIKMSESIDDIIDLIEFVSRVEEAIPVPPYLKHVHFKNVLLTKDEIISFINANQENINMAIEKFGKEFGISFETVIKQGIEVETINKFKLLFRETITNMNEPNKKG